MVLAQSVRVPFFPTPMPTSATPPVAKTLSPSYARMYSSYTIPHSTSVPTSSICLPPPSICVRTSVKDTVYNAGGLSIILYLISMVQERTKEYQRAALKLLHVLLQYCPNNTSEMKELCGYELLSLMMRKRQWILDESMLAILFSFVGLKKSVRATTYTSGVISNLLAFKHLILERKIWQRAHLSTQKLVYQSLAELVSVHEHASFNIKRFNEAGVMEIFLQMFKNFSVPKELAGYFIAIIRSIMNDPPRSTDLQCILNYLIETHQTPHIVNYSSSMESPASHIGSVRSVRKVISFDTAASSASLRTEDTRGHMRCLVLKMLLGTGTSTDEMSNISQIFLCLPKMR